MADDENQKDKEKHEEADPKEKESILHEKESSEGGNKEKKESKKLLTAIAVLIVCFGIAIVGVKFFGNPDEAVTIDDLHERNLAGEESERNYMYEGYSFVNSGNLWYTQLENKEGTLFQIPIHYGPRELEGIPIMGSINSSFSGQELYLTFDPLQENLTYVALSSAEISLNLVNGMGLDPKAACTTNESIACKGREVITGCEEDRAVIYLKQEEEPEVMIKGNCVIIKGQGKGLLKAADAFLLKLYQVF